MAFNGSYFADLPMTGGYGIKTQFGTIIPPGGKVAAYVRSTAPSNLDDTSIYERWVPTLAAACRYARSGTGDVIQVLPGHSENVTDATMLDDLREGTKIIGSGWGSNMPTFRWTATGGQWTLDQANCVFSGLRLRLEGASGVVKALLVTAADNVIVDCDIEMASGSANKAAIGIECGTGSARFTLANSTLRGSADIVTDGVKIVAAVDGIAIVGNDMYFGGTAATGLVHATAAATNLRIVKNLMQNIGASSAACIGVDNVAATGAIVLNFVSELATGAHTSNTTGINLGAAALIRCFDNKSCNDPRASGLLMPTVDT